MRRHLYAVVVMLAGLLGLCGGCDDDAVPASLADARAGDATSPNAKDGGTTSPDVPPVDTGDPPQPEGDRVGDFTTASTLLSPRGQHVSFIVGNKLYVFGGIRVPAVAGTDDVAGGTKSGEVFTIQNDGSLGPAATAATSLVVPRRGASAIVAGDYVYVLGGFNSAPSDHTTQYLKSVERARKEPDGSLGSFQLVPNVELVNERAHASAVLVNQNLYVLGGVNTGVGITRAIERLQLNTGSEPIGTFSKLTGELDVPRVGGVAFAGPSYILIMGGHAAEATPATNSVSLVTLDSATSVTVSSSSAMLRARYYFAGVQINQRLTALGGSNSMNQPNESASWSAGEVSAFANEGHDFPRLYHFTTDYAPSLGKVYVTGGCSGLGCEQDAVAEVRMASVVR